MPNTSKSRYKSYVQQAITLIILPNIGNIILAFELRNPRKPIKDLKESDFSLVCTE